LVWWNVERDAVDSRWVYYSINRAALEELITAFGAFFDPGVSSRANPNAVRKHWFH
jgi:hypothetical protein